MTTLKVNDKAPNFVGLDQQGKTIQTADFAGKKYAVYFYPKDNTPGCTVQACNLRDNYDALSTAGISIIGVSMDTEVSHLKFISKFELPFPLIADTDKKVIETFQVWGPKKFMGKDYDGIHRTTFVMDENNVIQGIISKPKTKEHASEILEIFNN
jgi:peroxiredoxin Q/BCP